MRLSITFILLLLLSASANAQDNPNFIIILVDDQGWNGTSVQMSDGDPLSKSDYHQTPNIEKLANSGMRFSSAYASAPVCSPSRYSIQFGKTPARLGMIRVGMSTKHINHNTAITIPKLLKQINPNYKAAHFGKWGIRVDPAVLGYNESDGITGNKDGGFDHKNNRYQWRNNVSEDPKKIFSTTKKAIDFVERQANSNTPFYLQLSHYAVHSDIVLRATSLEKYKALPKGKYQKHAGFAAMTEDLDSGVGLLLDKVKALGLDKNTYVIYTSDNGAVPVMPPKSYYAHGTNTPLSRGKWDAMEGGIRVPFIISGPRIKRGATSQTPISFSDILPTVVDLAGAELPLVDDLDGGSFKKLLFRRGRGKVKRNTNALIFHVPYENGIALNRAHSAILIDRFKLIKFYDNNEIKLFDLDVDYEENHDVALSHPEKAKMLELVLETYLKEVKAPKWKPGINWKQKTLEQFNSYH